MKRSTFALVVAVLVLCGAAGLVASASAATTYYVAPAGTGSACTAGAPCSLATALGAATSGSTVVMEGNAGPYFSAGSPDGSTVTVNDGVTLTGDPTEPMPVLYSDASLAVEMTGTTPALADLDIEYSASSGTALLGVGTVSRVIVHATLAAACNFGPSDTTVSETVCNGQYAGVFDSWNAVSPISWTVKMYNDTVLSVNDGMYLEAQSAYVDGINFDLENTIVHTTSSAAYDIDADSVGGGLVYVEASHSNYASVYETGSNVNVTTAGSATNQTATPQFVSVASDNLAEAAGSPTIGAGVNDPTGAGPLDVAGAPREIAGRTDIGAYELVYAPALTTLAASSLSTAAATLGGTVNPNGVAASYHFEYGTSAAYGSSTPAGSLAAGVSAQSVSATLSSLAPGTTYHYRLVATNSAGTTDGPDETFTTAPLPAISAFTQSRTRWRRGSAAATFARARHKRPATPTGTTFSVTLNEQATLSLSFVENVSGRRGAGGVCVAQTNRNKRKPRCTYTKAAGTLSDAAHAGANTLRFDGVLSAASKLPIGSYSVAATATAFGSTTPPQTLSFTIVKR